MTSAEAERQLFKGFFSVDSILQRLKSDYARFTASIVKPFSDAATYRYINAPYVINGKSGTTSPPQEVLTRLDKPKPILFLIEAAAGFGKTCTAYEIVSLLADRGEYLPLFSELSRNREARIFRHILLYEIDRSFPLLGSRLVQTEMTNGRVITILDGFDELLRNSDDGKDFENSEPMLETIGEFLKGSAKVVLTTRRTVLFEGDAFHSWVEKHNDDFDLVTIRISEPRVPDWLSPEQISSIQYSGLSIEHISNPVLLSYLRCIPQSEFQTAVSDPNHLVDRYFDFMLERERTRQDLRIGVAKQHEILRSLSEDMLHFGYTSEQREYVVDHILKVNSKILDEAILLYPTSERPTKEEIANKLASHALLDRSTREPNKIGFINEFVFGHYVAETVLSSSDWLNDDLRFIEPAVLAYQPRAEEARHALWECLRPSTDFLTVTQKLDVAIRLLRAVVFPLLNDEAEGLTFDSIRFGNHEVTNFQFNDCLFKDCVFDLEYFNSVTFLNCRFYGNVLIPNTAGGPIYVLGAAGDESFINALVTDQREDADNVAPNEQTLLDKFILEKFWPVGRPTVLYKHRPIKGLCTRNAEYNTHQLFKTITSLKKRGLLLEPIRGNFVELNFEALPEIRAILEA